MLEINFNKPPLQSEIDSYLQKKKLELKRSEWKSAAPMWGVLVTLAFLVANLSGILVNGLTIPPSVLWGLVFVIFVLAVVYANEEEKARRSSKLVDSCSAFTDYPKLKKLIDKEPIARAYVDLLRVQNRELTILEYRQLRQHIRKQTNKLNRAEIYGCE